jgi:hypothetical protein
MRKKKGSCLAFLVSTTSEGVDGDGSFNMEGLLDQLIIFLMQTTST